jgi:hypothetical protein
LTAASDRVASVPGVLLSNGPTLRRDTSRLPAREGEAGRTDMKDSSPCPLDWPWVGGSVGIESSSCSIIDSCSRSSSPAFDACKDADHGTQNSDAIVKGEGD